MEKQLCHRDQADIAVADRGGILIEATDKTALSCRSLVCSNPQPSPTPPQNKFFFFFFPKKNRILTKKKTPVSFRSPFKTLKYQLGIPRKFELSSSARTSAAGCFAWYNRRNIITQVSG